MTSISRVSLRWQGPGAVVYCDPPYWPLSDTAYFTAYDGNPFRSNDQERLARAFAGLREQGATGVLSNSGLKGLSICMPVTVSSMTR